MFWTEHSLLPARQPAARPGAAVKTKFLNPFSKAESLCNSGMRRQHSNKHSAHGTAFFVFAERTWVFVRESTPCIPGTCQLTATYSVLTIVANKWADYNRRSHIFAFSAKYIFSCLFQSWPHSAQTIQPIRQFTACTVSFFSQNYTLSRFCEKNINVSPANFQFFCFPFREFDVIMYTERISPHRLCGKAFRIDLLLKRKGLRVRAPPRGVPVSS